VPRMLRSVRDTRKAAFAPRFGHTGKARSRYREDKAA
jgi:hypothetical protein